MEIGASSSDRALRRIKFLHTVVWAFFASCRVALPLAARHTSERQDNFDIYLPLWLARHNMLIFGVLYVADITYTLMRWRAG